MTRISLTIAAALALAACNQSSTFTDKNIDSTVGDVVLMKDNQMRVSAVHILNGMCWVEWYSTIDRIALRRDGRAPDPPFIYKWEIKKTGGATQEENEAFFDAHCKDPK